MKSKEPKAIIEDLIAAIQAALPKARVRLDSEPTMLEGYWFVDVAHGIHTVVVEYAPSVGFGLSSFRTVEGHEEPDEMVSGDIEDVVERVVALANGQD